MSYRGTDQGTKATLPSGETVRLYGDGQTLVGYRGKGQQPIVFERVGTPHQTWGWREVTERKV